MHSLRERMRSFRACRAGNPWTGRVKRSNGFADAVTTWLPRHGALHGPITADTMTFNLPFGRERIELSVVQPVNADLTSADILHDVTVDEIDFYLVVDRGETAIGGLVFDEPGTYIGYCSVEGHREARMEIEIVVTPSG